VEKAHPDVFNSLLQIMDDGRLTDSKGRMVDFKNTILIMTSNVGSDLIKKADIGFSRAGFPEASQNVSQNKKDEMERKIKESLKDTFKPEFLNRIDELVMFVSLSKEDIRKIVVLEVAKVKKMLDEKKVSLSIDEAVLDWLAAEGYSEEYGARPLKRLIQKEIEDELSQMLIGGNVVEGDDVDVVLDGNEVKVAVKEKAVVQQADF
jgi:ATP-dependent Clp protease ATP-binding subunit ClpC